MQPVPFTSGGAMRHALRFELQESGLHRWDRATDASVRRAMPGSADPCLIAGTPIDDVARHPTNRRVSIVTGPVRRSGVASPSRSIDYHDPDANPIEVAHAISDESHEDRA